MEYSIVYKTFGSEANKMYWKKRPVANVVLRRGMRRYTESLSSNIYTGVYHRDEV